MSEGPFNKNETVKYEPQPGINKIGKIVGLENGKYRVLFEDGSESLLSENLLKRTQILLG